MKSKAVWYWLAIGIVVWTVYTGDSVYNPVGLVCYYFDQKAGNEMAAKAAVQKKEETKSAQRYLNGFGYNLKVTGTWDAATEAAAAKYVIETHKIESSTNYLYYITSDIHRLVTAQHWLNIKGNYQLATDGIYEAKTKAAIIDYQKRWKLPVTGRNDDEFYQHVTSDAPDKVPDTYARGSGTFANEPADPLAEYRYEDYPEEEYYEDDEYSWEEDDNIHHVDPHYVEDYYREDGTHVDGYWRGGEDGYERSDPDGFFGNNLN